MRLPPPSSAAISRMEQALQWFGWLEAINSKIVWLRASGKRWKDICWAAGLLALPRTSIGSTGCVSSRGG